jgi:hypothetical protein
LASVEEAIVGMRETVPIGRRVLDFRPPSGSEAAQPRPDRAVMLGQSAMRQIAEE